MKEPNSVMSPTPRPLRADAERNRRRIMASATVMFAERGLDASLDDIAEHAGVGVGTVYRRFADRDALIEQLFTEPVGALADLAESLADADDPWVGFVTFVEVAACQIATDLGLADALIRLGPSCVSVATARARLQPAVTVLVERAQRAGRLRPDLAETDVHVLLMMLTEAARSTASVQPEWWRRALAVLLDGMATDRPALTAMASPALLPDQIDEVRRSSRR